MRPAPLERFAARRAAGRAGRADPRTPEATVAAHAPSPVRRGLFGPTPTGA